MEKWPDQAWTHFPTTFHSQDCGKPCPEQCSLPYSGNKPLKVLPPPQLHNCVDKVIGSGDFEGTHRPDGSQLE